MPGLFDDPNRFQPVAPAPAIAPVVAGGQRPQMVDNPGLLGRLFRAPAAVQGLLSPEDLRYARAQGLISLGSGLLDASRSAPGQAAPGLGQAIARGLQAGQSGFQQAVQGNLSAQDYASQRAVQAQQRQLQQQLLTRRQQIADHFAPTGPETPAQTAARLRAMYAAYVRAGDLETAGKLGEVIKTLGAQDAAKPVQHFDAGDREVVIDPLTGKEIATYQHGAKPVAPGANAPKPGVVLQNRYTRAHGLTSDFARDASTYKTMAFGVRKIASSADAALAGEHAAQAALLYGFIKLQDPNSSVLEGERADAGEAPNVPTKIRQEYNKLIGGGRLTREQVLGFINQAQRLREAAQQGFTPILNTYRTRARSFLVDPADVTIDYFNDLPSLTGYDATPTAGAGPLAGVSSAPGTVGNPENVAKWLRQ